MQTPTPGAQEHPYGPQRTEVELVYQDQIKPNLGQTKSTLTRRLDIITKAEKPKNIKQMESYAGLAKSFLAPEGGTKFDLDGYFRSQSKPSPAKALQQLQIKIKDE